MSDAELTAYERIKVQMEFVVPLLRDLQAELGDDVITTALEARLQKRIEAARAKRPAGVPVEVRMQNLRDGFVMFAQGDTLEYEELPTEAPDRLAIDVTSCGYSRLMDSLDARDLGHLLICSEDHVLGARGGTTLERSQTCMQGASHCDFRFGMADD